MTPDALTDPALAEKCAESLAEIWCRKGELNASVLHRLTAQGRLIVHEAMTARSPERVGRDSFSIDLITHLESDNED